MTTRALVLALCVACVACRGGVPAPTPRVATGGSPKRGEHALAAYGCGACHTIPGVRGARGEVGPPLTAFGQRSFVAGRIPTVPNNLIRWILYPQSIDPQTAMPMLNVRPNDARDMAAYLYTLK